MTAQPKRTHSRVGVAAALERDGIETLTCSERVNQVRQAYCIRNEWSGRVQMLCSCVRCLDCRTCMQ